MDDEEKKILIERISSLEGTVDNLILCMNGMANENETLKHQLSLAEGFNRDTRTRLNKLIDIVTSIDYLRTALKKDVEDNLLNLKHS